jgi:hypothetical protein
MLSGTPVQVLAAFRSQSAKLMGSDGADRDFGGEVPLEAQVSELTQRHTWLGYDVGACTHGQNGVLVGGCT